MMGPVSDDGRMVDPMMQNRIGISSSFVWVPSDPGGRPRQSALTGHSTPSPNLAPNPANAAAPGAEPFEVEIKIRVAGRDAYDALREGLGRTFGAPAAEEQENHFFDGKDREMLAAKMTLRLRRVASQRGVRWLLALKADAELSPQGLSTAFEDEREIDAASASAVLSDPQILASVDDRVAELARTKYPCRDYERIGGYSTTRLKYRAVVDGHLVVLELDETRYSYFAETAFELEVEVPGGSGLGVGKLREFVEDLLRRDGIPFSYSRRNKFRNMLAGSIE
ncbi:CYTH-like domain-containing protein [Hyaloraphidium curvatum]|nr:CYTH-like domain-containing protein [Hyaloraphidium curvatum]